MTTETEITWWLGQHLTITTALAAIVFLICRVVRLSPAARHALWLLVLCRLLVPPIATWPCSIPIAVNDTTYLGPLQADVVESNAAVVSVLDAVPAPDASFDGSNANADENPKSASGDDSDVATVAESAAGGRNRTASGTPLEWPIVGLWGFGSVLATVVMLVRIRRVGRVLKNEADVDNWLRNDIAAVCARLAVRVPDCVITGAIRSPFLWCLGRVRLVWPLSASRSEQREQACPILVHELAHLRRRDHWMTWIELVALIVWWWNPVFWFVRRQLRASAEMACDAWVVELLPDQRRAYAETLVEFGRRGRKSNLAFGAVGADTGSRRLFKRRLEMIMNEETATRLSKWTAISAVLLGLLSLPTFAVDAVSQPEDSGMQTEAPFSDDQTLAELSEQFNVLMKERRFAEATIVARKAEELDPKSAVTLAMAANSERAAERKQDESKSESVDANGNASTTAKQRVFKTTKKRVVQSTLHETAGGGGTNTVVSLNEVLNRIEQNYYGQIDRRELERAAIQAIMSKLDGKSTILTREELEQMTVSVEGGLVGVGVAIHLDSESKLPVVTRPIRNSPGLAAGLRRDDVILSIDGDSTEGMRLAEIVKRIRGPRGTSITLGIQRADETLDVTVTRERFETLLINPWSISAEGREDYWADRDGRIGYAHIPAFTRNTVSQLQKVMADLKDKGMKGLVLDLRDCGGGLLTAATELVDMFIDDGIILSSQGRSEAENITFRATEGGEFTDLPLVVLINGHTASAAEIVAACLQDHHRAAMVGEQTFGRGTVQSLFRLNDGGALKLTTAAWLRPNGKTLLRREGRDDWGVQPDTGLKVAVTEEVHKQLAKQRESRLNRENVDKPVEDPQLEQAIATVQRD